MNRTLRIRYDMRSANEAGVTDHPQREFDKVAVDQSLIIVDSEAFPIGDCWIFTVTTTRDKVELPDYLQIIL